MLGGFLRFSGADRLNVEVQGRFGDRNVHEWAGIDRWHANAFGGTMCRLFGGRLPAAKQEQHTLVPSQPWTITKTNLGGRGKCW